MLFFIIKRIFYFSGFSNFIMWTTNQLRMLIDERKGKNSQYHELVGNGKIMFWQGVASHINLKFGTNYSGTHCKEKFQGLIRDYKVIFFELINDYILLVINIKIFYRK